MTGIVAGMGARAVLGAAGRRILGFLRSIPPWLWLAIAAMVAIAWLAHSRGSWKDRALGDEAELAAICQDVRAAAGQPKLPCDQARAQIQALGKSLQKMSTALDHQNDAIESMAHRQAEEQRIAAKARRAADERAARAEAAAAKAKASAAKPPAPGEECEPSETMKELWK